MNNLEFDILKVIALRYPYSYEQIKLLYNRLHSYDELIFAIELSIVTAMDLNSVKVGDTES